jgi:hypothetical protein
MRCSHALGLALSVHGETLLSSYKRNLNYIRLYLNKGKNGISMVITHEQGILTRVLRLDNLKLFLVPLS